jgi:hypothetical protein
MQEMLTEDVAANASQSVGVSAGDQATGGAAGEAAPLAIHCKARPWQRQAPITLQRSLFLSFGVSRPRPQEPRLGTLVEGCFLAFRLLSWQQAAAGGFGLQCGQVVGVTLPDAQQHGGSASWSSAGGFSGPFGLLSTHDGSLAD